MDLPLDEIADLIDRVTEDFVSHQRDPASLTTLCGIELFQMLKADLVGRRLHPTGRSKRELREATFARSSAIRPNRHVDTLSFTKTPEQVAHSLLKRKGIFDDPVTGRRLVIKGPTYQARGEKGDEQMFYLVIEECSDIGLAPRHALLQTASPGETTMQGDTVMAPPDLDSLSIPVAMTQIGSPTIYVHIVNEDDVDVADAPIPTQNHLVGESTKTYVAAKMHYLTLESFGVVFVTFEFEDVKLEGERCSVQWLDGITYRGTAYATIRLPPTMDLAGLPTLLAVHAVPAGIRQLSIQYSPKQPELVWRGMLDTVRHLDPRPLWSQDSDAGEGLIWGPGPGNTHFHVHWNPENFTVSFSVNDPTDFRDAMRNFPLRSFLRDKLGILAV